ncbi:MAG: hypothetical protein AAF078_00240 [Planctomycetota bacterium]
MALNDPIQQPVEVVGADEAVDDLRRVGNATDELGDAQQEAGRKADQASDQQRELGTASEEAGGGISGLVVGVGKFATSALAAIAAGSLFLNLLNSIRDTAKQAREAIADLGEQNRGLAANVGGLNADVLIRAANDAALQESLGVQGRNSLIASATSLTDLRGDLSQPEIVDRINGLARLQRATGVGGTDAVELLQSFESRLGLTGQAAIDQAAGLLNAGIAPQTLGGIIERVGETSGTELLDLLFAVRDQVNLSTSGEAINSVFGAVTRTDANGRVDPLLASLGVTEGQSPIDRLAVIAAAFESGEINQGQFQQVLGGNEGLRIGPALARELADGLDDDRAERLRVTADSQIANIIQSGFVRAADRRNTDDLREAISLETSALGGLADVESSLFTELREQGGGSAILGLVGPGVAIRDEVQRERLLNRIRDTGVQSDLRRIGRGVDPLDPFIESDIPSGPPPTVINNYFNGPTITGSDPFTGDIDEREARPGTPFE